MESGQKKSNLGVEQQEEGTLKNFIFPSVPFGSDVKQQQQQDWNHSGGDYFHFPLLAL
jgi:hypothetical protein